MESYFNRYKIESFDDILANAVHNQGDQIGQNLVQLRLISPNASMDQVYQVLQNLAVNDPSTLQRVTQVKILKEDNNTSAGNDSSGFDWSDVIMGAISTAGSTIVGLFGNAQNNNTNNGQNNNGQQANNPKADSSTGNNTMWIIGGVILAGLLLVGIFSMASNTAKPK